MIRLNAGHWRDLITAVEAAYPEEACGLLVGRTDVHGTFAVGRVIAATNVATAPQRRFEIDPRVHFAVLRELRGGSERIIGHYHSHPDGPAAPSKHDVACACDRQLVWLILAITAGKMTGAAAFAPIDPDPGYRRLGLVVEP